MAQGDKVGSSGVTVMMIYREMIEMKLQTWALSRRTSKSACDRNWLYNTPETKSRNKECVKAGEENGVAPVFLLKGIISRECL